MEEPLLLGVFDVLEQLIVSDNSTLVSALFPTGITPLGSQQIIAAKGVASFSFVFLPFITGLANFSFTSVSTSTATFEFEFRDCEAGEIRTESGCFPCAKNSYSFNPSDPACLMCPSHAQCLGRTDLVVDKEYWRATNSSDVIYQCLVSGSCQGGLDSVCAAGYQGALCNSCAEGYYRYASWQCRNCEDELPAPARGVIIAILVIGVAVTPSQLFLTEEGLGYRFALALRLFITYAQSMMFVTLLHSHWSFNVLIHSEVMRVIGSLGGLLLYTGCRDAERQDSPLFFQATTLAFYPALLLFACCFVWPLIKLKSFCRNKEGLVVLMSAWCISVYNYLPVLCLVVVSLYQCQGVAGETLLVADMNEKCWTGSHLRYVLAVATPLVVVAFCIYLFAILCIFKPPKFQVCQNFHKYLTAGYRTECKHWEIYVLIRKIALPFLSVTYSELDAFSSSILLFCVFGFSIQSNIKWCPYQSRFVLLMSLVSHISAAVLSSVSALATNVEVSNFIWVGTAGVLLSGAFVIKRPQRYRVSDMRSKEELSLANSRYQSSLFQAPKIEESDILSPPPPSFNEQGNQIDLD